MNSSVISVCASLKSRQCAPRECRASERQYAAESLLSAKRRRCMAFPWEPTPPSHAPVTDRYYLKGTGHHERLGIRLGTRVPAYCLFLLARGDAHLDTTQAPCTAIDRWYSVLPGQRRRYDLSYLVFRSNTWSKRSLTGLRAASACGHHSTKKRSMRRHQDSAAH